MLILYSFKCYSFDTVLPSIDMLNVIMLNIIMLNVIMLNVIILSVIVPNVVAPDGTQVHPSHQMSHPFSRMADTT
jgi:hypothetical protein